MTQLQVFLRNGGTPAQLLECYFIKATRHKEYPSLVLFKYNQIESPFSETIVQQSRGVILDEANGWVIVSRPFEKFFNFGEPLAAEIDWSTARVQEKLDGSLCSLYHHDGQWHVATSGTPDASGDVNGMGITFRELFWDVFSEHAYATVGLNPELTYMFELMTPYNRVVVRHERRRLVLLAARDRNTGEYQPLCDDFDVVRSFPLQSMEDITRTFDEMNPLEQEGYVIVDGAGRRVKVKHPGYVAIHHMRDGFGPKRFVEVIRSGETTELLSHFPEWRPDFERIQSSFDEAVSAIERDYEEIKTIPVQKDFALRATQMTCPPALFMLRSGKAPSARQFLADLHIARLMDLLKIRDTPVVAD